ncbi:formimidoylglutamase [Brachybacterium huguangmaarense]|uniref:Formimidoylglutamase n=1 Tax=Brachybacterium huguangmaarense TaxID=1652028 RepID=A0ABY6G3P6_9MICO|nr:formimidoylglutamase [Brachybacterium huguangmaarense]UYG17715.1 formimidoylglutamase [Brachybacterium huguangmaarense]
MPLAPADPRRAWTGRHDGDGPEHARWHEVVRPAEQAPAGPGLPHVGVLGFESDEGVRRNQGRIGAADGPEALRRALAPLALHGALARGEAAIRDHGDAVTCGEDLEAGQDQAAVLITRALDAEGARLVVVLGGGHETAWASYRGLRASRRCGEDTRWGVLNLDAHFDLRREDRATSGTPFAQMAEAEAQAGRALRYGVLGIAEPSNTPALFTTARELGVTWMTDVECAEGGAPAIASFVANFAADLDVLYLTIDLDVLPAAVAPGVSAPAGLGVAAPLVATAVRAAAATGALALVDVVELCPPLDVDARTARTGARLVDEAVRGVMAR